MRFLLLTVVLGGLCGCSDPTTPDSNPLPQPAATASPHIDSITPAGTAAGVVFNRQPDGSAAFSVNGSGFAAGAVITANGEKLTTAFGNAGWVTAVMPRNFYAQAGRVAIQVTNPDGATSNTLDFEVKP
jgi:hypothetical protein